MTQAATHDQVNHAWSLSNECAVLTVRCPPFYLDPNLLFMYFHDNDLCSHIPVEILLCRHHTSTGPSFINPCNFTCNYAVYWSQLATNSQCSLRQFHETNLAFEPLKQLNSLFLSSCRLCCSHNKWQAMTNIKDIQCKH